METLLISVTRVKVKSGLERIKKKGQIHNSYTSHKLRWGENIYKHHVTQETMMMTATE